MIQFLHTLEAGVEPELIEPTQVGEAAGVVLGQSDAFEEARKLLDLFVFRPMEGRLALGHAVLVDEASLASIGDGVLPEFEVGMKVTERLRKRKNAVARSRRDVELDPVWPS